jgi:MFS family permease
MPAAAFTHRQIVTILSGLMLGILLAALDQTIVSTAIRTIADDLHGLNLQAWTTTAYLITATISTPLYGKLSDLYGRKPFYLAAISIFIVGSVLCTISTSMYELAVFRAVQGLGAGGLMRASPVGGGCSWSMSRSRRPRWLWWPRCSTSRTAVASHASTGPARWL